MGLASFIFWIWFILRVWLIILIIVFLISGLDDLWVDLAYYARALYRNLFRRHLIKPITREQLNAAPEQPIAMMVPAWDEAAVIAKMLLNTASTINYKNYHIFVGTYPNDEATQLAVNKVREIYPQVSAVVTPADGPTNKADCLNWVIQNIFSYEQQHGIEFAIFVMHDAEDIIHPLSFKYFNYLIPRVHMIQLPVFALEWHKTGWVAGIYIDEFSELHSKDLRARELLSRTVPSAGVGTALSRTAITFLRGRHRQQVFDIRSLTEDYQLGMHLRELQGKKIFLQQAVERIVPGRHWLTRRPIQRKILDHIATREFFPNNFRSAVRQRARWIMGIAIQGWQIGWTNSLAINYYLFRDRKSLLTNLLALAGYPIVLCWIGFELARWLHPDLLIPSLIETKEIWFVLMLIVLGLLAWRLLNRMASVWRHYGIRQGLWSAPRLAVGNVVNFWATIHAIRRYLHGRITGQTPAWGKTEHAYPSADQLRMFHRKLGDLLLDRRLISTQQLETALANQKQTGAKLGKILIDMGVLWEKDLVSVLAQQSNLQAVEIDLYQTRPELLRKVPRELAQQYRIFPLGYEGDTLILATDLNSTLEAAKELERLLAGTLTFRLTSSYDIDFAIARGYALQTKPKPSRLRLGEQLLQKGLITPEQLREALRRQKRDNRPLGEILIEMKLFAPEDIKKALAEMPAADQQ